MPTGSRECREAWSATPAWAQTMRGFGTDEFGKPRPKYTTQNGGYINKKHRRSVNCWVTRSTLTTPVSRILTGRQRRHLCHEHTCCTRVTHVSHAWCIRGTYVSSVFSVQIKPKLRQQGLLCWFSCSMCMHHERPLVFSMLAIVKTCVCEFADAYVHIRVAYVHIRGTYADTYVYVCRHVCVRVQHVCVRMHTPPHGHSGTKALSHAGTARTA